MGPASKNVISKAKRLAFRLDRLSPIHSKKALLGFFADDEPGNKWDYRKSKNLSEGIDEGVEHK